MGSGDDVHPPVGGVEQLETLDEVHLNPRLCADTATDHWKRADNNYVTSHQNGNTASYAVWKQRGGGRACIIAARGA